MLLFQVEQSNLLMIIAVFVKQELWLEVLISFLFLLHPAPHNLIFSKNHICSWWSRRPLSSPRTPTTQRWPPSRGWTHTMAPRGSERYSKTAFWLGYHSIFFSAPFQLLFGLIPIEKSFKNIIKSASFIANPRVRLGSLYTTVSSGSGRTELRWWFSKQIERESAVRQ